jgi:hypothetical protein
VAADASGNTSAIARVKLGLGAAPVPGEAEPGCACRDVGPSRGSGVGTFALLLLGLFAARARNRRGRPAV